MRNYKNGHSSIDFALRWSILFYLAYMMASTIGFAEEGYISVQALAIDTSVPQTLYAGTSSGVFKSTDGGRSWKGISNESLSKTFIAALAIDPKSPQTVYAATDGGDLFKSTDGGENWKKSNQFIKTAGVRIDPSLPQTASAGQPQSATINYRILALAIVPSEPQTIYAVTSFTVFKSTNGGSSWTQVNTNMPIDLLGAYEAQRKYPQGGPSSQSAVDDKTRENYREKLLGMAKKNNETSGPMRGLTGREVLFLAADTSKPQSLFAVTSGYSSTNGVFKSTDGGSTWMDVRKGLPEFPNYTQVVIAPSAPNTMYAFSEPSIMGTTSGGVFKSTDGGSTWTAINNGLPKGGARSLAIDPSSPQTVYAGFAAAGVFKSADGGSTWTAVNKGLPLLHDTAPGQAALMASNMPAPQKVYCELSNDRYGMSAAHYGVYVDPDGNIYRYSYSYARKQAWQPLQIKIGPRATSEKLTEQKIANYYDQYEKKLIRKIDPEEWQAKHKLLNEASMGQIEGIKGCGGNDIGEITYQCFIYTDQNSSYQKVQLRRRGDSCYDNSSTSAKELADWLASLRAEAFPQPKSGLPFSNRGGQ
jgi:photosystem II stability/assembly factor-like uncharacterized protein